MSVKRYSCNSWVHGMYEGEDAPYVLHSDYAALLARHNALREAVEWLLDCLDAWRAVRMGGSVYAEMDALELCNLARAEVDRLLQEEN